ncbi:MAG: hypothetical protein CLLPBCKN_003790 [Chroococcidiopsis cubana SAG 39.79]|nr:hypothetical protein [Chroococcidiopsis cubana SAG 39.79]
MVLPNFSSLLAIARRQQAKDYNTDSICFIKLAIGYTLILALLRYFMTGLSPT